MENPLTEEQIKKINEITKLPKEKQQEELQKFLPTLNEEQINFLKTQQQSTQKCLFCSISQHEINSKVVYEDDEVMAFLDINPANKGHILIMPKQHLNFSYQLNSRIFDIANYFSQKLKKIYDEDTNIYLANGVNAGQKLDHLIVHVIPRHKDDGINFTWQPKKVEEQELDEIQSKLKYEKPEPTKEAVDYKEEERIP